jgi:endogenous inhibitor of DNA gyrase (YacG/DUF329 family)
MRVTCPTCGVATTWEENLHRPFCSERCRMIDLGRWATEAHRIPGEPAPDAVPGHPGEEPAEAPDNPVDEAADAAVRQADGHTGA